MQTAPPNTSALQPLPINTLKLAWRLGRSDWKSPQLRLLLWSVVWAVAAVTAVAFLVNRVDLALARDAQALLGGEIVVIADQPLPVSFAAQAQDLGLQHTGITSFVSMARAASAQGSNTKLAAIKAVATGYPLRGALRLAPPQPETVPPLGSVWVEPALLNTLKLRVGDSVLLGASTLRIAAAIEAEPDKGFGFTQFLPRIMMNRADIAATGLVQPASRVRYRLLVATADAQTALSKPAQLFQAWAKEHIAAVDLRGVQLESLDERRPEVEQTTGRAQSFLNLVTLLTVFFCAVAVALAARLFARQRLDSFALLRVLGLTRRQIAWAYFWKLSVLALGASLVGLVCGGLAHFALVELLKNFLPAVLPAPGTQPWLLGAGVGLSLVLSFGMAPLLRATRIPALHVLRQQQLGPLHSAWVPLGLGLFGLTLLVWWYSQNWLLTAAILLTFAASSACIAGGIWGVLTGLRHFYAQTHASRKPAWRMALFTLMARRDATVVQATGLTLSLMALALLFLLRTELLAHWRDTSLVDAPNRFAINILPEQLKAFEADLTQLGVKPDYDRYPMVRGRLLRINDKPVIAAQYEGRARRLVEREFNLSFSPVLPYHNRVATGQWRSEQADGVSVEQGLAEALGLRLGDTLVFDLAGIERKSRITSVRKVNWSSMHANFYALYPVSSLPDVAYTYLLAFYVANGKAADQTLVQKFPNVTLVDVSATIAQLQNILNQAIQVIELLFVFTLGAGLLVLVVTLQANAKERIKELAIFRALGAGKTQLHRMLRYELFAVGALAGVLAALVASALGAGIMVWVLDLDWFFSLLPLLGTPLLGALLAYAVGWHTLSPLLQQPVLPNLRSVEATI